MEIKYFRFLESLTRKIKFLVEIVPTGDAYAKSRQTIFKEKITGLVL